MKTINKLTITAVALTAVLLSSSAFALSYDNVVIESWVGSVNAANSAILVVDFDSKSFAWGYRWDGKASGYDMLTAVAGVTDLDVVIDTQYGSPLFNSFSYHGYKESYDSSNWSNTRWWEYWTSTDGSSWTSSWVGSSERVLSDGAWDGWSWSHAWPATGTAPETPATPEPMTLAALTAGLGALVARKRKI